MSQLPYLTAIKTEITNKLPALLTAAGISAMDEYVIGGPTDEEFLSVGCYLGPGDKDDLIDSFNPVVQMQLRSVNYVDSLKYYDVLYNLLNDIDPKTISMTSLNRLSVTEYPPDETGTSIYLFFVQYRKDLDDCN